ncbi:RNA polymerase sigma factor [Echinicola sp. 20G]|uniref:RNA polymerase sigma factor n=1 Tax=Echinicola sp. 20G TaxID=2781961 RepID=UPI00190FC439|nr:sigma-70 family RNA polymerase sigma factor [Echinicola sp. 20G]
MKNAQNNTLNVNEPGSAKLLMQHSKVMIAYTEKSDSHVWESFKRGEEKAFNYIYREHVRQLYNYGMQVCKEDEWVRDSLQMMFVDLRKRRSRLGEVKSIKGYLFTVFHRTLFKLIKSKRKGMGTFVSLNKEDNSFFIEASHETKLIAEEFSYERKNDIEAALNKLSQRERQAIILLYREELSYKEIAEIMDFKEVKTARTLVYRAMNKLKGIFNV